MTKSDSRKLRKQIGRRHEERAVAAGINQHRLRNSPVYAELAVAPAMVRHHWLSTLLNPLQRRYAEGRINDAMMDIALSRIDQLDPTPFMHQHEGCPVFGARSAEQESEHDVFAPREGYITDPEAYSG